MEDNTVVQWEVINIEDKPLKRTIPQRIDLWDVPQIVKDALWIVEGQKTYSEYIEADPQVQASLSAIKEITEGAPDLPAFMEPGWKWPDVWTTMVAREKRNKTIIDLASMWLTYKTILNTINDRNRTENRGHLEWEKSLRRIIVDYYNSMKPSASEDMGAYEDAMREAAYSAQDKAIESLSLTVKKGWNFKSDFERSIALEKLINAHQLRIENRGWNKTRATPFSVQQTNNHINIVNQHIDSYTVEWQKEVKIKSLLGTLDKLLDS
jgi:hypothetical protein